MNRIVFSGLVLASIVAVCLCIPASWDSDQPLCTPEQWEGVEASFGGYIYHRHPGIIKEHNQVHYDAKNKRKASFITYINNDYENKFQVVIRYDDKDSETGKVYYVDLKKDKCWIKKLDKPFRTACLPADAKVVHDYSLGPATGGLKVTGYLAKKEKAGVYISVVKSGNNIIPVTETVHGDFWGTSFIQGIQYADITPGIKNETVFDIPKQCEKEEFNEIPEYLTREHFILAV